MNSIPQAPDGSDSLSASTSRKPPSAAVASLLHQLLAYDPETGALTWRVDHRKHVAGEAVGCVTTNNYRVVIISGFRVYAQVLAWFLQTGLWPDGIVGFRDRDARNLRFSNLQEESHATNQQRRTRARGDSTTQVLGVCKLKHRASPYLARIRVNGVTIKLGYHRTAEAAGQAYQEAKRRLHTADGVAAQLPIAESLLPGRRGA